MCPLKNIKSVKVQMRNLNVLWLKTGVMLLYVLKSDGKHILNVNVFQDLYCVRSDLGNLLKALGRLEEAKVCQNRS